MSWTTPVDLRIQVLKLWDRGLLLATLAGDDGVFPRRLTLKKPTSRELSERFSEVRLWIEQLVAAADGYRIEWCSVNHRVLGVNEVPAAIWVDCLDDALGLIGKRRAAQRFEALLAMTRERQPELLKWLCQRPLRALDLADDWTRLLDVVAWLKQHPLPGIYLRQIDLPGVHTKFIEEHRSVLAELFDLVLPLSAINEAATGRHAFCRRYGFMDKPARVRFRLLDPALALLATSTDQDITLTAETFALFDSPVKRVFITENEINFLAFPSVDLGMVIFGGGYGFQMLTEADWLCRQRIYYWGDIDTHGFAILDQFRSRFPQTASFLMDDKTLLAHRLQWGGESDVHRRELHHLTADELSLYDKLRSNNYGFQVRLEQERIGFDWVVERLKELS